MSYNTVVLRGELGKRHEEAKAASGSIKPGYLVEYDGSGEIVPHSKRGGKAALVAKEDAIQGNTMSDVYTDGDPVLMHRMMRGDKLVGCVAGGAAAIALNDLLQSAGNGTIEKAADGQLLYSNVAASAAITASSTETAFDKKYTLSANQLKVGDVIRVKGQVIATTTNSTDTLTVKLYLGGLAGTAIFTSGAVDVANNDICVFEAILIVRSIGATGTFVASGYVSLGASGTATMKEFNLGSTAVDTTGDLDLTVSGKWSTTDAGNSCRLDMLTVEQLGVYGNEVVGRAAEAVDNSGESDLAMIAYWVE